MSEYIDFYFHKCFIGSMCELQWLLLNNSYFLDPCLNIKVRYIYIYIYCFPWVDFARKFNLGYVHYLFVLISIQFYQNLINIDSCPFKFCVGVTTNTIVQELCSMNSLASVTSREAHWFQKVKKTFLWVGIGLSLLGLSYLVTYLGCRRVQGLAS